MNCCVKHPHESGVAICRRCGGSWCADCLVYSFGERKPPFCMSCAMVAGGVRTSAARPALGRREIKALQKAAKAEAKAAAKAAKDQSEERESETVAAMSATPRDERQQWSQPWWESAEPTFAD